MKFTSLPGLWRYTAGLSADVNFLDLASIVSRSSVSNKGQMGAVIILPSSQLSSEPIGRIRAAVNTPMVPNISQDDFDVASGKKNDAEEIHAEALLISLCAANGLSTAGSTMYITFPPCKSCFMSLCAAGVKRVVFRRWNASKSIAIAAHMNNVTFVEGERFSQRPKPGQKWSKRWADKISDEYAGKIIDSITDGTEGIPGRVVLQKTSDISSTKRRFSDVCQSDDHTTKQTEKAQNHLNERYKRLESRASTFTSTSQPEGFPIADIPSDLLDSSLPVNIPCNEASSHIAPLMYGPENPSSDVSRNSRVQSIWLNAENPAAVLERKERWWKEWHDKVAASNESVDELERLKVQHCIEFVSK